MASIRETARSILEDAKGGICWIAIWKTGKSWHAETMYGVEYCEERFPKRRTYWTVEADDENRLLEILQEDPEARLVNGYYANLGPFEDMTLASLIDGIEFQYGLGGNVDEILEIAERA